MNSRIRFSGLGIFFVLFLLIQIAPVSAYEPGKTYDKTNYQKIEALLPHGLLQFVKSGYYILPTEKLEFENKQSPAYLEMSQKNEGKFDVDPEGNLIEKATGNPVEWYQGYPFPNIDPADPKVCFKIMHNFQANRFYFTANGPSNNRVYFVGQDSGIEREVESSLQALYYLNRTDGPKPNPNGFMQQSIINIMEPFNLRGTIQMSWIYLDERKDASFAYVPMLRRVRRTSSTARSDPFLGGDSCTDDSYGYLGKIADMSYKFIGERRILVGWMSEKWHSMKRLPDGSVTRPHIDKKLAAQTPGSQQIAFAWEG